MCFFTWIFEFMGYLEVSVSVYLCFDQLKDALVVFFNQI